MEDSQSQVNKLMKEVQEIKESINDQKKLVNNYKKKEQSLKSTELKVEQIGQPSDNNTNDQLGCGLTTANQVMESMATDDNKKTNYTSIHTTQNINLLKGKLKVYNDNY